MTIHSSGEIVFDFSHIEGLTLSADEEVNKVARGASGMSVTGELGDRHTEGQAVGVY